MQEAGAIQKCVLSLHSSSDKLTIIPFSLKPAQVHGQFLVQGVTVHLPTLRPLHQLPTTAIINFLLARLNLTALLRDPRPGVDIIPITNLVICQTTTIIKQ